MQNYGFGGEALSIHTNWALGLGAWDLNLSMKLYEGI